MQRQISVDTLDKIQQRFESICQAFTVWTNDIGKSWISPFKSEEKCSWWCLNKEEQAQIICKLV